MRVAVIQHVAYEGPAMIADVLAEGGHDVQVVRTDLGVPVPQPDALDALVVMGGPMGALDDLEHPHLPVERRLIGDCVRRGAPVLGVCLGAQLLAAALGGRVHRGPSPEVGVGTVQLTEAGRSDPVLGGAGPQLDVLHWHEDTFTLPPGAVLLASSSAYAHQAFRAGRSYGLQFHVELDPAALAGAAEHLPASIAGAAHQLAATADSGRQVLRRWADAVLGRRQVVPLAH